MSADASHAAFPSDETLAAFIDGKLDAETRKRVVEHMTVCAECRGVALAAPAMGTQVSNVRRPSWQWAAWAAAIAATIAVAVILFPVARRTLYPDPIASVVGAVPPEWPIEGRLEGFPYRPRRPIVRGDSEGDAAMNPSNAPLLAAFAHLQQEVQRNPSPENLRALGVAHLLLEHPKEAVNNLEAALTKETGQPDVGKAMARSTDAALLNDLSAAYGERARLQPESTDDLSAVGASARAVALRPTAENEWNYALALERLRMRAEALAAWRAYLRIDPSSGWSQQAREHVRALLSPTESDLWDSLATRVRAAAASGDIDAVRRLTASLHQELRQYVRNVSIPQWTAAFLRGDEVSAARALTACRTAGEVLAEETGDSELRDEAALLARKGDTQRLLAETHQTYEEALHALSQSRLQEARAKCLQAEQDFAAAGSDFRYEAQLDAAACRYRANDSTGTEVETSTLLREIAPGGRLRAVVARAEWLRGSALTALGRIDEAVDAYSEGIRIYTHLGETDNTVALTGNLATLYEFMGDVPRSWTLHRQVLALWDRSGAHSHRTQEVLSSVTELALRAGQPAAARVMIDAAIARADLRAPNDIAVRLLLRRAELDTDDARSDVAARDFEQARVATTRISDPNLRNFIVTHPVYVNAVLRKCRTTEQRLNEIESALQFAKASGSELRQTELYLALAREQEHVGRGEDAATALRLAVAAVDRDRTSMHDVRLRERLVTAREDVYREFFMNQMRAGRYDSALALLDRSRAQTLRDAVAPDSEAMSSSDAPLSLPDGIAAIVYWCDAQRLVMWVVERGVIATRILPLTARERQLSVDRCLSSMRRGDSQWRAGCTGTSRLLLGESFAAVSSKVRTVVFVPDDSLYAIPFAALPFQEGIAADRFRIIVSPSISIFRACVARAEKVARRSAPSVLIVSEPSSGMNGGWSPLPAVAGEVAGVRAVYRRCKVVGDGDHLTAAALLNFARHADVIHFAGHAFVNRRDPRYSGIVLQARDEPRSYLYANEIAAAHFDAGLVVLSACDTAVETMPQSIVNSIGSAFLTAGIPTVVGSLWPVDDRGTAVFMRDFHARLAAGADPATALRDTQRLLSQSLSPSVWAAFRIIGGSKTI